ncbi:glycosyltransferase family 1 protein [Cohnella endophytica]|uniref:Glycosyltransferase family 1 protein n=1 Tax=Cohnella endophytica TaxID=2419778 RepID=A0A494XRE4_9BACL|nr:glycosyltransferase family 1 protein [Cohnella endophytica]RKP53188.1 glycosyltransferase family 1 protein [Cohnella endophytica]
MTLKKIYINARFLTQSITGVQRYAIELVKSIDRLIDRGDIDASELKFTLIAPRGAINGLELKHIEVRFVGKLKGHLWEQFELPFFTGDGLLLNLCNTSPIVKRNQVTTIHDASVYAVPQTYSFLFRAWYKLLFSVSKVISRSIITDSDFSKKELIQYCKIAPSKIRTIYLGKEHIHDHNADPLFLSKINEGRPFLLAVSSMSPNKNFGSILQAVELMGKVDFDIVIAGGTNPKIFSSSHPTDLSAYRYLGYVDDSQLRTLYENADCFIYPSYYEGFGLPPLEAMASGCPVIVSNTASLPEVCGDAVLYCDPHSPKQIAESIHRMMGDPQLRANLRTKGLERAKQFSWEKCSGEIVALIREVLKCELPSSTTG